MHRKPGVIDCFTAYIVFFEKQSGYSVKCLHSDNGGEYEAVVKFAKENGVRISRSALRAPQANGIAERANRTIVEMIRSALISSGVSKCIGLKLCPTPCSFIMPFRTTAGAVPMKDSMAKRFYWTLSKVVPQFNVFYMPKTSFSPRYRPLVVVEDDGWLFSGTSSKLAKQLSYPYSRSGTRAECNILRFTSEH